MMSVSHKRRRFFGNYDDGVTRWSFTSSSSPSPLFHLFATALICSALSGFVDGTASDNAASPDGYVKKANIAVVFVTSRDANNLTTCRHGLVHALQKSVETMPQHR